jgi:hypothetical protein
MNERIEKLAREAALAEGWGPGVWQTTFTEKFAELIVRECANMLDEDSYMISELGGYAHDIRKHFGVKE